MTIKLHETSTLATKPGLKARIRLISEGIGSSGTYPADVLARDGASAFPAGTQLFMNHITQNEDYERDGSRDIKDLVGVTLSDAEYDAEQKALYADAKFYSHARDFVEEAFADIGLSIEARGLLDDGVVESLVPHPLNSVALVPRGGRDGRIESLYESYRETYARLSNDGANALTESGKDTGHQMTEEDIKKITEAVTGAIAPLFTTLQESLAPAPADEDETGGAAVDVAAVTEAVVAADLPESARKRVYESMKAESADIKALIESEKAYIADVLKEAEADSGVGRVNESAKDKSVEYGIKDWK